MTKSSFVLSMLAAAALLVSLTPSAAAHGAAPPADYLTRILSDYSDDWVSASSNGVNLGARDGHNIIALDGYTQVNQSLGDVVVFRLILDGGYSTQSAATGAPELAEHITFKANGKDQEYAIHTEDNAEFSAELGFKAVRGPEPQLTADGTPDGTRFFVEGLIPFADLGIKAGDPLSDFFVQGEAGDGDGDAMPQYDVTPGGVVPDASGDTVHSDIGTWAVPGTDRYVKTTAAAPTGPIPATGDVVVTVGLTNAFNESQSIMAMAYGDGVWDSFTGAPTLNVSMGMLDLAGAKSGSLQLHLARPTGPATAAMPGMGDMRMSSSANHSHSGSSSAAMAMGNASAAPTHGVVNLVVTTSLGGRQVIPLHVEVAQPAPAASTTDTHTHSESKKSPALGLPALVLAAAALVALRRR